MNPWSAGRKVINLSGPKWSGFMLFANEKVMIYCFKCKNILKPNVPDMRGNKPAGIWFCSAIPALYLHTKNCTYRDSCMPQETLKQGKDATLHIFCKDTPNNTHTEFVGSNLTESPSVLVVNWIQITVSFNNTCSSNHCWEIDINVCQISVHAS